MLFTGIAKSPISDGRGSLGSCTAWFESRVARPQALGRRLRLEETVLSTDIRV